MKKSEDVQCADCGHKFKGEPDGNGDIVEISPSGSIQTTAPMPEFHCPACGSSKVEKIRPEK